MREARLNAGKAARFRVSRGRLAGSIAGDLHSADLSLSKTPRGAILPQNHSVDHFVAKADDIPRNEKLLSARMH
jgi:hypothetical protein